MTMTTPSDGGGEGDEDERRGDQDANPRGACRPQARRGNRGLRAEVRRNAKGIKTVNAKVGRVNRRVTGVVAVNAAQSRQIGKLDKRVKLDGALEFAESWNGSQVDLFAVFKGAVKSGLLDNTKGAFASPVAIGGVGLLLNVLRNNPGGLGALLWLGGRELIMPFLVPLSVFPREDEAPPSAAPAQGLRINLPLGLGGRVAGSSIASLGRSREERVLRAVAAASALSRPKRALELSEKAKEKPSEVIEGLSQEEMKALKASLIDPVTGLLDNRTGAPAATDQHTAAARAVGADPVLVAAAHQLVQRDQAAADAAARWVAAVDAELLDRAARAGAREIQLEAVPAPPGAPAQLNEQVKQIEIKLDAATQEIRSDLATIDSRVSALEQKGGSVETKPAPGKPAASGKG